MVLLTGINYLAFETKAQNVFCEIETATLHVLWVNFRLQRPNN